jgi:hypothetical protein
MASNPGYQKKRHRFGAKKHHFGSKYPTDPGQARSSLVVDRLGHVARVVKDGERFLIDSS